MCSMLTGDLQGLAGEDRRKSCSNMQQTDSDCSDLKAPITIPRTSLGNNFRPTPFRQKIQPAFAKNASASRVKNAEAQSHAFLHAGGRARIRMNKFEKTTACHLMLIPSLKLLKLMSLTPLKGYHSVVHPTTDCSEGGTGKNA